MTSPSLLAGLLTYIEEVERLNKTPAFTIPGDVLALAQAGVVGLPGVATDLEQDGPVWLSVPRLQEVAPPALPAALKSVVQLSANPGVPPALTIPEPVEGAEALPAADIAALAAGFEEYLVAQWRPWSDAEQPRRKTIALYKALFALYQHMSNDGEAPLELVWGMGVATWAHPVGKDVKHPLMTQACFIELDKESFTLAIRPRDVEPQVELDCYVELEVPGVRELEAFWAQRRAMAAQVNPFQPDTFADVLRTAVGYLDPEGEFVLPGTAPAGGDHLSVATEWVLFARKRSADVFVADVRRFQSELAAGSDVPGVIHAFVAEAPDSVREAPHLEYRGLSSSSHAAGVQELYFPLPYNDEQVDIVRKLEHSDGVVVQGPPGTGKTHTIANIISHYLAQGKRVLVTSKGDTALSVLQDKLPAEIRSLSVSLLSNERAGMKQFEHSIQQIAARLAAIRPAELEANIKQLEAVLAHSHAAIAAFDADIAAFSRRNSEMHVLDGREYTAESLAQLAVKADTQYAWFDDQVAAGAELPFDEATAQALRRARRTLGENIAHVADTQPALVLLPAWKDLATHRATLLREHQLRAQLAAGVLPALQGGPDPVELQAALILVQGAATCLAGIPEGVLARAEALPAGVPLIDQLMQMAASLDELEQQRLALLSAAVAVPDGAEQQPEFVEAVGRLAAGRSPFALGSGLFGKKDVKRQLEQCLIVGQAPQGADQWRQVEQVLPWRRNVLALVHRWNALCGEFGLPSASLSVNAGFREVAQHLGGVGRAMEFLHRRLPAVQPRAQALFGPKFADLTSATGLAALDTALTGHLELANLAGQNQSLAAFEQALTQCHGEVANGMRHLMTVRLGTPGEDAAELADTWLALVEKAGELSALAPTFDLLTAGAEALVANGMPRWAKRLTTLASSTDEDPVLPADWRDAWTSKVACALLADIDGHRQLRALFLKRAEMTEQLERTYRGLVAERAWLGVYRNSTDKTKQALQSFLTSIQAMGAGTGVRAIRHRRAAREAMEKAYLSVPCWVLPQWRISETLPAEMGLFDLVVIDEASQSDISSLPAILRGQKLLVVGDHKQVSPAAVGVSEAKISAAYERLLKDQPHGAHMTSDKSIYDLARVVFAGQSVMLKEHFRCVPEIIEYSNREFYNGEIRALRVPREDERMDPPLVDVLVQGGHRIGDKNLPEAKAIVDEIEAIVRDPWMDGKTIGVVTLLGHEQARLITEMIAARISPDDIVERDIVVGQPPAFQGRERDIIMLSMVQAPGDRSLSSALPQQQRLNVAMSRARDRMYLFRSVPDGQFPADSPSGRLLAHFRQPYRNVPEQASNLRERCESGFERDVFDELARRGYRLNPQVQSGGYRIDLVVEGANGKRLAIECDGDRFHGADKWADDMARQRVLERAGWTFWRCFASSFTRRRQDVMLDLLGTLDSMGIEPLGEQHVSGAIVESRKVDPMGVERSGACMVDG
jgi:very-short-patch-repair endonuclease